MSGVEPYLQESVILSLVGVVFFLAHMLKKNERAFPGVGLMIIPPIKDRSQKAAVKWVLMLHMLVLLPVAVEVGQEPSPERWWAYLGLTVITLFPVVLTAIATELLSLLLTQIDIRMANKRARRLGI